MMVKEEIMIHLAWVAWVGELDQGLEQDRDFRMLEVYVLSKYVSQLFFLNMANFQKTAQNSLVNLS
jgi:hypothetical protein